MHFLSHTIRERILKILLCTSVVSSDLCQTLVLHLMVFKICSTGIRDHYSVRKLWRGHDNFPSPFSTTPFPHKAELAVLKFQSDLAVLVPVSKTDKWS